MGGPTICQQQIAKVIKQRDGVEALLKADTNANGFIDAQEPLPPLSHQCKARRKDAYWQGLDANSDNKIDLSNTAPDKVGSVKLGDHSVGAQLANQARKFLIRCDFEYGNHDGITDKSELLQGLDHYASFSDLFALNGLAVATKSRPLQNVLLELDLAKRITDSLLKILPRS